MKPILGLTIVFLFYAVYLQRQFALRRHGIHTNRLGRGQKDRKTRTTEVFLLAITFMMPIVQVASILCKLFDISNWSGKGGPDLTNAAVKHTSTLLRTEDFAWSDVAGAAIGIAGVVFFLLAVIAMRDNWRAGIDATQKTDLVTRGVYRVSRNPAFVGFDLFYIGIAAMFPNTVLIALTLTGIVGFHLQIIREERYMRSSFGARYGEYAQGRDDTYRLFVRFATT